MNIFLSWSGDVCKQYADVLDEYIPLIIQAANIFFTPRDIEKGTLWDPEMMNALDKAQIGIICFTTETKDSEWVLFESGALSREVDGSRLCPILFGVTPGELPAPLSRYQTTQFGKEEFLSLMKTINNAFEGGIGGQSNENLVRAFETYWPTIKEQIEKIGEETKDRPIPEPDEREILNEILGHTSAIAKRMNKTQKATAEVGISSIFSLIESLIQLRIGLKDGQSKEALWPHTNHQMNILHSICTDWGYRKPLRVLERMKLQQLNPVSENETPR